MSASLPQPWPDDARRLFDAGGADAMRVVGGFVRDALLGNLTPDIDLDFATTHTPDVMTDLLEKAGIPSKPTGITHGTITAILNHIPYQITTLRQDVATDGRRAVIAYTTDWAVDAARRDFTINALYADAGGVIHDPIGLGLLDIERRFLRFIGDAPERIREDYLRILRLFRFLATLPDVTLDEAALTACADLKAGLGTLSAERVTGEMQRLLQGPRAGEALRLMRAGEIAGALGVRDSAAEDIMHLNHLRPVIGVLDPILSFYLAFGMQLPPHIRVPRRVRIDLGRLAALSDTSMSWQEAHYRAGGAIARALFVLRRVRARGGISREEWADVEAFTPPRFPAKAQDLEKEGFFGAALGLELKKLETTWLHSIFGQKNE